MEFPRTAMPPASRARARTGGFSLVEVLVSIVVLSIGMLGMVGLQARSLQANREARLQSSAVAYARELGELVRGNRSVAFNPAATNPYVVSTANPSGATALTATTPSSCLAVGSTCASAAAIGNAEMTDWLARVDNDLPGPRVVVCFDDAPYDSAGLPLWTCTPGGSTLVVKIGWTRAAINQANATTAAGNFDRAGDANSRPGVVLPLSAGYGG